MALAHGRCVFRFHFQLAWRHLLFVGRRCVPSAINFVYKLPFPKTIFIFFLSFSSFAVARSSFFSCALLLASVVCLFFRPWTSVICYGRRKSKLTVEKATTECNWIISADDIFISHSFFVFRLAELPETRPLLWTERDRYESGDLLKANCSSPPSRPRINLRLTVNNIVVSNFIPFPFIIFNLKKKGQKFRQKISCKAKHYWSTKKLVHKNDLNSKIDLKSSIGSCHRVEIIRSLSSF